MAGLSTRVQRDENNPYTRAELAKLDDKDFAQLRRRFEYLREAGRIVQARAEGLTMLSIFDDDDRRPARSCR